MPPLPQQLELVAAEVICILKRIKRIGRSKLAVIGGLAAWKHDPFNRRETRDVDFIISAASTLDVRQLKCQLLALPRSPFIQLAEIFYFQIPQSYKVQIDFVPEVIPPFMPAGAVEIRNIPDGHVPYISAIELFIFKVNCCGMRALPRKRCVDAEDAEALLKRYNELRPLILSMDRMQLIEPFIGDLVRYGHRGEKWWRAKLAFTLG